MSRLTIEASTPLCLLQDAGRFGVRHLGVTQGGALDWVSMSWANWLLGNALDAPVVEITLGGFTLQAEDYCLLALAGADLGAYVDERPLTPGRSFILQKGQRLRFTQPFLGPGPIWPPLAVSTRPRCWAVAPVCCVKPWVAPMVMAAP